MKKLSIFVVSAFALMAMGCGNSSNKGSDNAEVPSAEVATSDAAESVTAELDKTLESKDANAVEALINEIQEKYAALVESGDIEAANAYASKVKAYFSEHASEISDIAAGNTTVGDLITKVKNLPTDAKQGAESLAGAVQSDVQSMGEAARENVEAAVQDKVEEAQNAAADAVNSKVEEAGKKATDAINDAASKIKVPRK